MHAERDQTSYRSRVTSGRWSGGSDQKQAELKASPAKMQQAVSPRDVSQARDTVASPASVQAKSQEAQRRTAALWIAEVCDCTVPYDTPRAFRAALRDGVLLCQVLNTVMPGALPKVLQADGGAAVNAAIGNFENVQNFLKAVIRAGLPQDALFSVADLQNDSHEDKPTVVDCLLWLKQQGSQRTSSSSCVSSPVRRQSGASAGAPPLGALLPPSSHPIVPSAERMAQDEQQSQAAATAAARVPSTAPQPPATAAASAGQPAGAPSGSAPLSARSTAAALLAAAGRGSKATAAAGVTDLMQRCTRMLREKSWGSDGNAAAAAAAAQQGGGLSAESSRGDAPNGWCAEEQALATVMQSVMNGVTQSYEQKLLAKDAEAKEHQRKLAAATNRLNELAAHQQALMAELAAARAEAVASAKQESAAVISGLTQQVDGLTAENAALKAEVEAYAGSQDDRVAAVRAELAAVREQLAAAEAEIERLRHFERNYRAVQDENRRLYNQVQDLRGNIRVFCRIRPLGTTGDVRSSCALELGTDGELALYEGGPYGSQRRVFKFDKVFDQAATQEQVYADTQPLIRSVLDGYNVCIFAYGQTGSGKTHTMTGSRVSDAANRGINYRALDDLFKIRDERAGETTYSIRVQMLEIYNETLRDLLVVAPPGGAGGAGNGGGDSNRLEILLTQASGCNVPGAVHREVSCTSGVIEMMTLGAANRHCAETKMNERSSRSHQILTVIVDGHNAVTGTKTHGCLHLVDLAGSERVSRSEATGDRLVEAQHINRSLSALGDVMAALASKEKHVPFRNSKLTQLLQDSLSGQAKVMMFMHVAPESSSAGESHSTLKFATRVAEITLGAAKKNVESTKVFEAQEAAHRLKAQCDGASQEAAALRAELDALRGQLEDERAANGALAAENRSLQAKLDRATLEAARRSAAMTPPPVPRPLSAAAHQHAAVAHGFAPPAAGALAPFPHADDTSAFDDTASTATAASFIHAATAMAAPALSLQQQQLQAAGNQTARGGKPPPSPAPAAAAYVSPSYSAHTTPIAQRPSTAPPPPPPLQSSRTPPMGNSPAPSAGGSDYHHGGGSQAHTPLAGGMLPRPMTAVTPRGLNAYAKHINKMRSSSAGGSGVSTGAAAAQAAAGNGVARSAATMQRQKQQPSQTARAGGTWGASGRRDSADGPAASRSARPSSRWQ